MHLLVVRLARGSGRLSPCLFCIHVLNETSRFLPRLHGSESLLAPTWRNPRDSSDAHGSCFWTPLLLSFRAIIFLPCERFPSSFSTTFLPSHAYYMAHQILPLSPASCVERPHSIPISLQHVKEDEMGGACSTSGEKRNAYKLLVGKPEGERPLSKTKT
jgi:hypothetical protein